MEINLYVLKYDCWDHSEIKVRVNTFDTIIRIKNEYIHLIDIPVCQQYFLHDGQYVENDRVISSFSSIGGNLFFVVTNYAPIPPQNTYPHQIFVKTLLGHTTRLEVYPTETIRHLQEKFCSKEGLSPHKQRLIFHGRQLSDEYTLAYYDIRKEDTIHITLRLSGD